MAIAVDPKVAPYYNVTFALCGLVFCSDCGREAVFQSAHARQSDGFYSDQAVTMERERWLLLPSGFEVACPACAAGRNGPCET